MKILVLGSNSFSGSHFIKNALENEHKVYAVSRSSEIEEVYRPYKDFVTINNFNFEQIDINQNLYEVDKILRNFKPVIIINFAAQSMVSQSWESPEHWYKTNVYSFSKLIDVITRFSEPFKYIHVSTPEVYGSTQNWIEENTTFNPSTPYAVSRAAGDMHLINYINQKKFPAIITRTANVYGPGQQIYRIVPKAILSALSNKKLILEGGGSSIRSFIHIDDASAATLKLCTEGKIGETYHISTQNTVSIRELVENIFLFTGQNFKERVVIGEDRLGKDFGYLLKSDKIRNQIMWRDQISLKLGLDNTIQWVRDNLDYLLKQPTEYRHKE